MKKVMLIAVMVAVIVSSLVVGMALAGPAAAKPVASPNVMMESASGAVAPDDSFSYPSFTGVRHVSVTIWANNQGSAAETIRVNALNDSGYGNILNYPVLILSVAPGDPLQTSQTIEFNAKTGWSISTALAPTTRVGYSYTVTYPAP